MERHKFTEDQAFGVLIAAKLVRGVLKTVGSSATTGLGGGVLGKPPRGIAPLTVEQRLLSCREADHDPFVTFIRRISGLIGVKWVFRDSDAAGAAGFQEGAVHARLKR